MYVSTCSKASTCIYMYIIYIYIYISISYKGLLTSGSLAYRHTHYNYIFPEYMFDDKVLMMTFSKKSFDDEFIFRTKFSYKISCSLRLQTALIK